MDPFLIFLTVIISVLTIVLVVVGIHVILILRNINKTLTKANDAIDSVNYFAHHLTNPLTDVKALGKGVKTGLSVAEYVASWLKNKKQEDNATS